MHPMVNPAWVASVNTAASGAPTGPAVITGLAGGATGYFIDQYANPRLLLADNPWALIPNAGRWGGTYQTDIDGYCNARGTQGFTAIYLDPLGNTENNGAFADGRTYDGVFPFTANGTPGDVTTAGQTLGLNGPFWQRVDYFIAGCARNGMTAWLNVAYTGPGDFAAGGALASLTAAQFTAYGAALAARYATTQNIIWTVGNDYFGGTGGAAAGEDTMFSALLTGLRGGGDTHLVSIHNYAESDSRYDFGSGTAGTELTWGFQNAQFSMVYTYIQTYFGVEYAYTEASPIPVIWGDGYFYQSTGGSNTYFALYDRAVRQQAWWALSSGARGVNTGSEGIWQWDAGSLTEVTTEYWYTTVAGKVRAAVEALPGWHKLIPDTSSLLVTAGRGTHATETTSGGGGTPYGTATTDAYVTASRVPDGSLALIYLSHATTITINQAQMHAGYAVTWIDPSSGATTAGTPGSSYNSGSLGNNSVGDPDWVLALHWP